MIRLIRTLWRGENDFDFIGRRRVGYVLSGLLVAVSVLSLGTRGLELGIDFIGGGVWEVPSETLTVDEARQIMAEVGFPSAKVQELTDPTGDRIVRIQAREDALSVADEITAALASAAGVEPDAIASELVGPAWGDEITGAARRALVWFFIAITAYITLRFEWKMAAAALVAVVHDIVLTVGVYSVFQFTVTPATVIAFLTILGYSLYDTIVVFDKVRENTALGFARRVPYGAIVNRSLNDVLMRSANTTITSLLPVLSILLVGSVALGASTLFDFGLALAAGMLTGTYSSVFVAAPVLAALKGRERRYRELAARDDGERPTVAAATLRTPPRSAVGAPATGPRPTGGAVIPPRPRKKRRR